VDERNRKRIEEVIQQEWPRVVATLAGDLGHLGDAEDAAQDAVERALRDWPATGLPDRPGAWLTTVARRRSIDRLRRAKKGREKLVQLGRLEERLHKTADPDMVDPDATLLRDDQLRLIFACCHPALSDDAQMALTLRSVGGLTTREISAGFLIPEATLAQRLVRAKKKIAAAAIPFVIPPDAELLQRTNLVRTVLYLIFNEGYSASTGGDLVRVDLCAEAIRLAGLLVELTPDDPESWGLLALMELTHVRRNARQDGSGELVLLADQDRSLWDRDLHQSGVTHLDQAMRLDRPGPFQLQAAISALHNEATDDAPADWEQIELLYRRLLETLPTPVVRLNHAVALHEAGRSDEALANLADQELATALATYRPYHIACGQILFDRNPDAAREAFQVAQSLATNEPERAYLERRLAQLPAPSK